MERHMSNEGFTIAEMCIVIFALGMFAYPATLDAKPYTALSLWAADYIAAQAEAIASAERTSCESEEGWPSVSFNEKGNVSRASTIYEDGREVTISLGTGRLVFK